MDSRQTLHILNSAVLEIENLRLQIKHLKPQSEAYDAIRQILGLTSRDTMGVAVQPDMLWALRSECSALETEIINAVKAKAKAEAEAKAKAEANEVPKAAEVVIDTSSNRPTR